MLTFERAAELLSYDPETGGFSWRVKRARAKPGDAAGSVFRGRYMRIRIDQVNYYSHRLAFLLMTGDWPKFQADHLDGNGLNNRWGNLRDATPSINTQNVRGARRDNVSGLLGVCKARHEKWSAQIFVDGKKHHLGSFATPELAHAVYMTAKRRMHAGCTI